MRHNGFRTCHFHAARNEQTEGEGEEQTLIGGPLEEATNGAIQIHRTTELGGAVIRMTAAAKAKLYPVRLDSFQRKVYAPPRRNVVASLGTE